MYTPLEPTEAKQILKDVRARSMPTQDSATDTLEDALSFAIKVDKEDLTHDAIEKKVVEKSLAILSLLGKERRDAFGVIAPQAPIVYAQLTTISDEDFDKACIIESAALQRFA